MFRNGNSQNYQDTSWCQRPLYPHCFSQNYERTSSSYPRRRVLLGNKMFTRPHFRPFFRPNANLEHSTQSYSMNNVQVPNFNGLRVENSTFNNPPPAFPPHFFNKPPFYPPPETERNCGNNAWMPTEPGLAPPFVTGDIWIETKSASGNFYYYHAKTRETRWEKPHNAQVYNLQQLKHMTNFNNTTPGHQIFSENSVPPVATNFLQPVLPPPTHKAIVPGMIMIPPPMCFPSPPVFTTPFSATVMCNPPPNIDFCNATTAISDLQQNPGPRDIVAETDQDAKMEYADGNININEAPLKSEEKENEKIENNESTISSSAVDYNAVSSFTTPLEESHNHGDLIKSSETDQSASDKYHETQSFVRNDVPMEMGNTTESEIVPVDGSQLSQNNCENTESCNEKSNEKSRPVSSTAIKGSDWYVVWTGDNKVFFYNCMLKISVWDMPTELMQRSDVAEFIKSPPLIGEVKEVCTTSNQNNKKIKMEDQEDSVQDESLAKIIEKSPQTSECKDEKENIPHETKVRMFREMLTEKKVSAFSTWQKELHKIVFDHRYVLLTMKERKQVYELHIREQIEAERTAMKKEFHMKKEKFKELLQEAGVTSKTKFSEFAYKHAKDLRYKSVEKLRDKEDIFEEFVQNLRISGKESDPVAKEEKFIQLLKENSELCRLNDWAEVKKVLLTDGRFKAVNDGFKQEKLFKEYVKKLSKKTDLKERENKITNSLRLREEEVKRDLSIHMKKRDKERELHKHESAVNSFKALLSDLIRSTHTSWRETKNVLKADRRWEAVCSLKAEEREQLFDDHIAHLNTKKRDQFRQLLKETPGITLTSTWREIRGIVQDDPRCRKFSSDERKCEREFKDYIREKLLFAKHDLKELLKETKLITYKSKNLLKSTNHLEFIEKTLQNDKRYLELQCFAEERKDILLAYIEKLHDEGPPPPPTAVDPKKR